MFIHEMFQQKPCVFSVEVFPPKKAGAAEETLYPVLRELCTLGPDYISVTYGAGGGTRRISKTGFMWRLWRI